MDISEVNDLIQSKPDLIKTIEDEEVASYVMDPLYFPILKVLRKGPKTVKEIEEEYNKIAKDSKSDKTIYRYLKKLQEVDLVKPAGQRVVTGKTATETLFCRTSYAYYLRNEFEDYWMTDEGERLAYAIGSFLSPVVENKAPNTKKLQKFFYNISGDRLDALKQYLDEDKHKELMESISDLDWQKFTVFYNMGSLLAIFLKDPGLLEDFRSCYD